MNIFTILVMLFVVFGHKPTYAEQKCIKMPSPETQVSKKYPSKEENMHACGSYSCNSCCLANLTMELAQVPLQMVGSYNYSQCGKLSSECSNYFATLNCYYQCSPNLYPWIVNGTNRLNKLPVCGGFCDDWFTACKGDKTCVFGESWNDEEAFKIADTGDGTYSYQCHDDQPCRTYAEVYTSSKNFCNKMWRDWVEYTNETANCAIPGNSSHNEKVVSKIKGEDAPFSKCANKTHNISIGTIVAIAVIIAVLIVVAVGFVVRFLCKRKTKMLSKRKTKMLNAQPAAEVEELNPST